MGSLSGYIKVSGGAKSKGSLKHGATWTCDSSVAGDVHLVSRLLVWSATIHREQCPSGSASLPPQRCLIMPWGMIHPAVLIKCLELKANVYYV